MCCDAVVAWMKDRLRLRQLVLIRQGGKVQQMLHVPDGHEIDID